MPGLLAFLGRATDASSAQAVSLAGQPLPVGAGGRFYQLVPANTALQALGPTGGLLGDDIDQLWIYPTSLAAMGAVTLFDGAIPVWSFPANQTLPNLAPIYAPFNWKSVSGVWRLTVGASASVNASGRLT